MKSEKLFLFCIVLLLPAALAAQTISWTGAGDGSSWHDPLNWNGNAVPGATNQVVVPAAGNPTVVTHANVTIRSLQCDASLLISNGIFKITNGASFVAGALTVLSGRTLELNGAGATFSGNGPTQIDGARLFARGGATLSLPGLTHYSDTSGCCGATFEANGSNSLLYFPNLTHLTGNPTWELDIQSRSGGRVDLPALVTIHSSLVFFFADLSSNSVIDLPLLQFVSASGSTRFEARDGALISVPSLVDAHRCSFTRRSAGRITVDQLRSLVNGALLLFNAASNTLANLTNANGAEFNANNGSRIILPSVRSYSDSSGCCGASWFAGAAGGLLSLPALTNLTGNPTWTLSVRADAAAQILLPLVPALAENIEVRSDGSNSLVDISNVARVELGGLATLRVSSGGEIRSPAFENGDYAAFWFAAGGGILPVAQLHRVTFGALRFEDGVSRTLPAITNVDHAELVARNGSVLVLPNVTGAVDDILCCGRNWEAGGAGSRLSLPALTQFRGSFWESFFEATGGGTVDLPVLASVTALNTRFLATGSNSLMNAPQLHTLANSTLSAESRGRIVVAPGALRLTNSLFHLSGGGTLAYGSLELYGNARLSGSGSLTGSVINISGVLNPGLPSAAGAGALSLQGNYLQGPLGRFVAEVGGAAGTNADLLQVHGNVTLDGTLQTALFGGYLPDLTNTFTVLTGTALSGSFTNYSGLDIGGGREFVPLLGPANVQLALAFSTGPRVVSVAPTGTVVNTLRTFDITFNEAMNSTTHNTNNYLLVGPATTNRPLSVSHLGGNSRRLFFPTQTFEGTYTLTIGPDIRDLANNPMNQDGDGINGEAVQDAFVTSVFLDDNGPPAILLVSPSGPTTNNVSALAITWNETPAAGSFTLADVTLSGPAGAILPNGLVQSNATTWLLSFPPQSAPGAYSLVVGPSIQDTAGNTMVTPFNGGFSIDRSAPQITSMTPSGGVTQAVNFIELTFNESVLSASFTAADASLTAPGGPVPITSIQQHGTNRFRLTFESQAIAGTYQLVVGPQVTDLAGNWMDQDNDGVAGEPAADRFTGQFAISAPDLVVTEFIVPASGSVGETLTLTWGVSNAGNAAVTRRFTEVVALSPDALAGNDTRIASFSITSQVPAGLTLMRTQTVTIPGNGPAGPIHFVLELDAGHEVDEQFETNNTFVAANPTAIPLTLTLHLDADNAREDGSAVNAVISRNGSAAAALSIALASSDTSEATVPAGVVIPAGQTEAPFLITPQLDAIADGSRTLLIEATALGFLNASKAFVVLDSDEAALTLTIPSSTLTEGATSVATIVRTGDLALPIAVALQSSSPGQLGVPAEVVIPAGTNSAAFSVLAVDDAYLESPRGYTITAAATNHQSSLDSVTVQDNDVPGLGIILSQSALGETDGPASLRLRRTSDNLAPVTAIISRSNPAQVSCASSVTFQPGEFEKVLTLTPVNDDLVDGNQVITLTVQCLETLSLTPIAPGVSTNLVLVDDDGPSLKIALARDWVCRTNNSDANTNLFTVAALLTRDGLTTEAVTATLSTSFSDAILLPASVAFAAHQTQALFLITATTNPVSVTGAVITVTAAATGYQSGFATLQRVGTCAPDLVISNLSVPAVGLTSEYFSINYRELNLGGPFSITNRPPGITNIAQTVWLSTDPFPGNDTLLGAVLFDGSVSPYTFLERSATFRLPSVAGDYWIVVHADGSNSVSEISEGNNVAVSAVPLRVDASYSATVSASPEVAVAGTPITLSGTAHRTGSGLPAAFELVSLHIRLRETTRVIAALTDAFGQYAVSFVPLPGEAGTYQAGAVHPGVTNAPTQDTFTLLGMKFSPGSLATSQPGLTTVTQHIALANLGDTPLTGLDGSILGAHPNLNVQVQVANVLAPFAFTSVALILTATADVTIADGFTVRVTSGEGAVADLTINAAVQAQQPLLVASPSSLVAGAQRGAQRFVEFQVSNQGGAPSGPLNVLLPSLGFLGVVSPQPLPALDVGQTNTVTLQLAPAATADLQAYTGNLIVTDGTADLSVPFSFRVLSTNTANLTVEVTDQFTYYAEGAPRVTNATVELKDALSLAALTQLTTGSNGVVVFSNIVEGYYELCVSAPEHEALRKTIFVTAGEPNYEEALIGRDTVEFRWSVVPTEIQDRTRLTIEAVFETVVPLPVVTVSPSVIDLADFPNGGVINLTVTNHGLLAAQDTRMFFSDLDCWKITPLITDLGTLGARSAVVVPVTICHDTSCTRSFGTCGNGSFSAAPFTGPFAGKLEQARAKAGGANCGGGGVVYIVPCGSGGVGGSAPVGVANAGGGGCGGGWFGGGPGTPGGWGSSFSAGGTSECHFDPCAAKKAFAIADCIFNFLPFDSLNWIKCLKGSYECYTALSEGNLINIPVKCVGAFANCAAAVGKEIPYIGTIADAIDCYLGITGACEEKGGAVTAIGRKGRLAAARAKDTTYPGEAQLGVWASRLETVLDAHEAYFGTTNWLSSAHGVELSLWLTVFNEARATNSDAGEHVSPAEQSSLTTHALALTLGSTALDQFLARWNRSLDYYAAGISNLTQVPVGQSTDFIATDVLSDRMRALNAAQTASEIDGYENMLKGYVDAQEAFRATLLAQAGNRVVSNAAGPAKSGAGICAEVRLRIDQDAVIARDAFRATLEMDNSSGSPLQNVEADLAVYDAAGAPVTTRFVIPAPTLAGISSLDGAGTVAAGGSASAGWNILPTTDSATNGPVQYFVSGTLRYTQDGVAFVVPLAAAPITVHPLAQLQLTYFHQRDVFADDPFTDELEPSVPYSLAVLVKNAGAGTARNLRITSGQPQIIENEKGLFIDFEIIATEVGHQNLVPSLTAAFGDVAPAGIVLGRWLLKSTLQGLFTSYSATFEHLDSLGDPRLSLFESVEIRELTRLVRAPGSFEDGLPDMLVNDFPDPEDLPDKLYLSDATLHNVSITLTSQITGTLSATNLEVQLAAPLPAGWSYLRLRDPGLGRYHLLRVVRSDGVELSVGTNAWVTDRTFVGGGERPVREFNLHLLDHDSTGSYRLIYQAPPAPDLAAPASQIVTLPAASYLDIPLEWSGADEAGGSGIAWFDVYVSDNGAPFTLWMEHTPFRGAIFAGEFGRTYAFYTVATDRQGNRETAPLSPDATTTVNRTNAPPTLASAPDQFISEGATVVLSNSASDVDGALQSLTFSLAPGAPPGAVIDPGSGTVVWLTGEGTGPSTNHFTIRVADNGTPPLTTTASVSVVVNELNTPPGVASPGTNFVNEGSAMVLPITATDADLPANQLRWSLLNPPAGASIDPQLGLFVWTPTVAQGPSTNSIRVVVTDDGTPVLSATQTLTVIVRDTFGDYTLALGTTNLFVGETNQIAVTLVAGADLDAIDFLLTADDARLDQLALGTLASEIGSASLLPVAPHTFALSFNAAAGFTLAPGPIAALNFRAPPTALSGFVPIVPWTLTGEREGSLLTNGLGRNGRVVVIGEAPLLELLRPGWLDVYGPSNAVLNLQSAQPAPHPAAWSDWLSITMTNQPVRLPVTMTNESLFFRVVRP